MGRTARDNRDRPHPKPVQRIELSEKNWKRRLLAAALLLVVGGAAIAYSVSGLFSAESGWQAIEASTAGGPTCADELVFLYDLGAGEMSARRELRELTALYSDACRKLFQLYHTVESFEGVVNLREISLHPNETLTVDEALYQAFEAVERAGDRTVYLGPVYARYLDLFNCEDDVQLVDFDPALSREVAEEYKALAAYAQDPQSIELRLLGDGQVCLYVSEEYLTYAEQEGIDCFLDFGWLRNAFITDYLAELMTARGFTHGSISSYDGFSRNLDGRGLTYALNLYDWVGDGSVRAAVMEYEGPMGIICLRDYPLNSLDDWRIYQLEDGGLRTTYLSPEDGRCRSAAHDLVCYSRQAGCGELALRLAPVYVAETLDVEALARLAGEGIHSIRCEDRVIYGTDPGLKLTGLYDLDGVRYTASLG